MLARQSLLSPLPVMTSSAATPALPPEAESNAAPTALVGLGTRIQQELDAWRSGQRTWAQLSALTRDAVKLNLKALEVRLLSARLPVAPVDEGIQVAGFLPLHRYRHVYVTPVDGKKAPGGAGLVSVVIGYCAEAYNYAQLGSSSEDVVHATRTLLQRWGYGPELCVTTTSDATWDRPANLSRETPQGMLLVARELEDGRIEGALLYGKYVSHNERAFVDAYVEPEDAERIVQTLRALPSGAKEETFHKLRNIDAMNWEDAWALIPPSQPGQRFVRVYRDNEWMGGMRSSRLEGEPYISWVSHADYYGSKPSRAKLAQRAGLEFVRANATLTGDYAMLLDAQALQAAQDANEEPRGWGYQSNKALNMEQQPALRRLCDWWNACAPERLREAGVFRLYRFLPETKQFQSGDSCEPVLTAQALCKDVPYALFEKEGEPTVVAVFERGFAHNREVDGWSEVYYVDGKKAFGIGCRLEEVNEAWISVASLRAMSAWREGRDTPGSC